MITQIDSTIFYFHKNKKAIKIEINELNINWNEFMDKRDFTL